MVVACRVPRWCESSMVGSRFFFSSFFCSPLSLSLSLSLALINFSLSLSLFFSFLFSLISPFITRFPSLPQKLKSPLILIFLKTTLTSTPEKRKLREKRNKNGLILIWKFLDHKFICTNQSHSHTHFPNIYRCPHRPPNLATTTSV